MKNRLRIALGRLASIEYQKRFGLGSDPNNYILPEEIIDSATGIVETILGSKLLSKNFTDSSIHALNDFFINSDRLVNMIPFDDIKNDDIIFHNPEWIELRRRAQNCLNSIGLHFDIDEL